MCPLLQRLRGHPKCRGTASSRLNDLAQGLQRRSKYPAPFLQCLSYVFGAGHAPLCSGHGVAQKSSLRENRRAICEAGDDPVSPIAIREDPSLALVAGTNTANRSELRVQRVFSYRHGGRLRSRGRRFCHSLQKSCGFDFVLNNYPAQVPVIRLGDSSNFPHELLPLDAGWYYAAATQAIICLL